MNEKKQAEIIDKLTKSCTCKGISRATIKQAIRNGCQTTDEIKKATGAMTGACHGRNCQGKIEQWIREYKEEKG